MLQDIMMYLQLLLDISAKINYVWNIVAVFLGQEWKPLGDGKDDRYAPEAVANALTDNQKAYENIKKKEERLQVKILQLIQEWLEYIELNLEEMRQLHK